MSDKNKKYFDNLISKTKIYLGIILILLIYVVVEHPTFLIPSILVYIIICAYTYYANKKRKNEISETLQDLTITVDSAAKTSMINSPLPLVILESDGRIIWKSAKFITEFSNVDILSYIDDLNIDIRGEIQNKKEIKNSEEIIRQIEVNQKQYKVIAKCVTKKKKHDDHMLILYFMDNTETIRLQKEYKDSKTCVGIIMIDNYDEIMQRLDGNEKPMITAELEKNIFEWVNQINGVVIKSDRDRYVYFFEQKYLGNVREDKFSILDKIKEIDTKEKIQFTLSISVSNEGNNDMEKYKSAQTAMDVVLGRGGDQAVIRENEIYKFFGGRVEEVEKRTKVKARVVANALENLIKESKKVMIMGHTNPDMDAIGSCMGIYRLAKTLDTNAYIVTSEKATSWQAFRDELEKDSEYEDIIINKEIALENIDEETLLVVVDTHKINYVDAPELLDKTENIVVVDHHRRSTDYIENAKLIFQEVYASSAAELVTEILQYAEAKVDLKTIEAESLYAGIMMDTKNFTFKTGVRTFEAAAYLRRCGVDIIRVKKWFQSDFASFNLIADIVRKAEIISEGIAISSYDEITKDATIICAKAADELLTISDITASFVLGNTGDKICISGRSIGDINVQLILEKLGGGGHITLAGAQVEDMTMEETRQELINRINEYFSEIE
ncbi:MAG: DHH family phosphoesterase [Clostridia bacterium]|nr:DHH family phosphoesterase [Clostridia bacterium]